MEWPEQLRLSVGEERVIRLVGFSSGGYRWQAQVSPSSEAVSVSVTPAADATTGPGSSDELVTLRGNAPGSATVDVTLARSWEPEPVEGHSIVVIVEELMRTTG
jgi:predicted secreted protein